MLARAFAVRYAAGMRLTATFATILLVAGFASAQELPRSGGSSTASGVAELFSPPPFVLEAAELPAGPVSQAELEKARAERDRAKAKSARWVRLQKSGVLSKVEAERAQRQASQANLRYEQKHVAQLRQQLEDLRARPASPELIATAEAALQTAQTLAEQAEETWKKLEVALAETNVARRRALTNSGLGSKAELRRAESDLVKLRESAK